MANVKIPDEVLAGPEGTKLKAWGASKELSAVGKPRPKIGAHEKVTGSAMYAYDVQLPRMLYAAVLSSDRAHARISSIDTRKAEALSGVRAVLTYKNIEPVKWDQEGNILKDAVRYVGEPVAALAAETEEIAYDAIRLIEVKYDPLAAVIEPLDAMKPGAPQLQKTGNIWRGKPDIYARGDIEKGFKEADLIFEQTYTTSVQAHTTMELHGCVAQWDREGLTVWDSAQGVMQVRDQLASRFNLPANKVRVICKYVGGGFGSKNSPKHYHGLAALLSKRTGRPVKLFNTREDEFPVSRHRPKTIQTLKAGVEKDGTLVALYHKAIGQCGPYLDGAALGARATGDGTKSLYLCANVRTEAYSVHTNTPLLAPTRGPGDTENLFSLEQFMDELAEKVGMDPLEFRKKNYAEVDQSHDNHHYSSKGLDRCYEMGAKAFGWRQKTKPSAPHKKRGIGMSSLIWHGNRSEKSQAVVIIQPDGTAEVVAGIASLGVGAETIFAQIAAEELGFSMENVTIRWGDSSTTPYTINTSSGSRTTAVAGPAVRAAAADARHRLLVAAARLMGLKPTEILAMTIKDGVIFNRDQSKKMTVAEVARKQGREMIIGTGHRPPNPDHMSIEIFGAQFVEVEVDEEVGEVKVLRAVTAIDCGRWINPLLAESQIQGGFIQGMGMALSEERIMDSRSGIQLNANLHEYGMPTSLDIPDVNLALDPEVIDTTNNINAKGLGEPPLTGAGAAIANAIYNATGVRVRDYPITPNRIVQALKEKSSGTRQS